MIATVTEPMPPGIDGVKRKTLPSMQWFVDERVNDPLVRRAAEHVVRRAPYGDRVGEAREIFGWVRRYVQWRRDPTNREMVVDPKELIARADRDGWAAGDCDDHATLTATLGHSVRLPIVYVLVGPDANDVKHVYAAMALGPEIRGEDDLLALDTGRPDGVVFGRHSHAPYMAWVNAMPEEA